jgi:hypothetical protein
MPMPTEYLQKLNYKAALVIYKNLATKQQLLSLVPLAMRKGETESQKFIIPVAVSTYHHLASRALIHLAV